MESLEMGGFFYLEWFFFTKVIGKSLGFAKMKKIRQTPQNLERLRKKVQCFCKFLNIYPYSDSKQKLLIYRASYQTIFSLCIIFTVENVNFSANKS